MATPPLYEKNAYLGIYITQDRIVANLAYSHYDAGRHYVHADQVRYDPVHDPVEDSRFWDEYFEALQERFGWEILSSTGRKTAIAHYMPFVDEGKGVSHISFGIHQSVKNRSELLAAIHSYLPTAGIHIVDQKFYAQFWLQLGSKLGYEELLLLEADLFKFDLYRLNLNPEGKNSNPIDHTKIYWDTPEHLIDSLKDKRLQAFASVDLESNSLINMWANFIMNPVEYTSNRSLHDALRSFFTVQALTMYNNKRSVLRDLGTKGKKTLVVATGFMTEVLDRREFLIGLLDGFQLRGSFDLYFDRERKITTLGQEYSAGINARHYIVPRHQLVTGVDKVYLLEVPGKKGEKKVAFSGEIVGDGEKKDIFALTPELVRYKLEGSRNSRRVFSGKFMKEAYVEGLPQEILLVSEPSDVVYENVYIDARFKPVVYGPDYRANKDKIKFWGEL